METVSAQTAVFISYSHDDKAYRDRLRVHLSPLERSYHIQIWDDGEIKPGEEWGPLIRQHLEQAQIILLLISADFVHSDYCYLRELPTALRRHERREAIVIPIILKDMDWELLPFAKLEALPVDPKEKRIKPVAKWKLQDEAWTSIQKAIRGKIEYLCGPRPVSETLNGVAGVIAQAQQPEAARELPSPRRREFESISAFWQFSSTLVPHSDIAIIQGTLSQFAPMLVGPPTAKRDLHRSFRRAIEGSRSFSEKKRTTINACLSISAGQMVQRSLRTGSGSIYLGLYNSIVRNSIPVFVERHYFEERVKKEFERLGDRLAFEARVAGRVITLDNSFMRLYFKRYDLDHQIPSTVVDNLCSNVLGLEVDGGDTEIIFEGSPRYLDGDIWLAVESRNRERFLTAFLDLTDPQERETQLRVLISELSPGSRVIGQFDELAEFVARGFNIATQDELIERMFRSAFRRETAEPRGPAG